MSKSQACLLWLQPGREAESLGEEVKYYAGNNDPAALVRITKDQLPKSTIGAKDPELRWSTMVKAAASNSTLTGDLRALEQAITSAKSGDLSRVVSAADKVTSDCS